MFQWTLPFDNVAKFILSISVHYNMSSKQKCMFQWTLPFDNAVLNLSFYHKIFFFNCNTLFHIDTKHIMDVKYLHRLWPERIRIEKTYIFYLSIFCLGNIFSISSQTQFYFYKCGSDCRNFRLGSLYQNPQINCNKFWSSLY